MTPGTAIMSRADGLPRALLAYAIALTAFLLLPMFVGLAFGSPPRSLGVPQAFTYQEAFDLLTPLVLIPLAWLALVRAGGLGRSGAVVFLVVAALWVEAQGIHLGANAIGDAFAKPDRHAFYLTVAGDLDYWLDETLSHWLWHVAWVAVSVLFLWTALRRDVVVPPRWSGMAGAAGAIHGATFFIVTVEGTTPPLGIPASLVLLAWSGGELLRGRGRQPVVTFMLVSCVVTLVGYLVWAALNGGDLPGFCEVFDCG